MRLTANEVGQHILRVVQGKTNRKELTRLALRWMLDRRRVPYEPEREEAIKDAVTTLLAMDEGPEYELTDIELMAMARNLLSQ